MVVEILDDTLHYTHSVYPSSLEVKSNVPMNLYQKPGYNYKLECQTDPARSIEAVYEHIDAKEGTFEGSKWLALL